MSTPPSMAAMGPDWYQSGPGLVIDFCTSPGRTGNSTYPKCGPVPCIGTNYRFSVFAFACLFIVWNSLPELVISADTTDTFKRRLDKFWQHQDILYDYKVELTGVGNRSRINVDDTIVL